MTPMTGVKEATVGAVAEALLTVPLTTMSLPVPPPGPPEPPVVSA